MDRLSRRLALAQKALATMEELSMRPGDAILRDASTQCFEYSFEAAWKTAQVVLLTRFGLVTGLTKIRYPG